LALLPDGVSGPQLEMRLSEDAAKGGVRRAYWTLNLKRADGTPAGNTRYASSLPEGSSARALNAFAEAAATANLNNFTQWLNK
ncbi:hypothetical protein, partial [Craterilacuibacter sp.]|uniref:hypothetical protein n=1 Tax=Craterilacuibacter sp. TaxID=2870909 RepID=UPI003F30DC57